MIICAGAIATSLGFPGRYKDLGITVSSFTNKGTIMPAILFLAWVLLLVVPQNVGDSLYAPVYVCQWHFSLEID